MSPVGAFPRQQRVPLSRTTAPGGRGAARGCVLAVPRWAAGAVRARPSSGAWGGGSRPGGGRGRAGPRRPHYKSREAARAEAGPARRARRRRLRGEAMPAAGSEGEEGAAGAGGGSAGEQPGPPKLCGYLQKLSGKGPLRGFRSRWFVFDPRRCYLYYFKGPQEALPLGHLDIASACFSYHQPEAGAAAAAGDEAAAFEVHSPGGAVAVLKVGPGARPLPRAPPKPDRPPLGF